MEPSSIKSLLSQVAAVLPEDQAGYLVGGAVRDLLLGRPIHDLDFVVGGDVLRLARQVADAVQGAYYPLDEARKTGRVILFDAVGARCVLDFAAFRGEDLDSDLRARDFTVNAMAVRLLRGPWNPGEETSAPTGFAAQIGDLIDPLQGAADLRAKILRACSPTAFADDPVRILRAVRLAAEFRFHIDRDTLHQLRAALPELGRVSAERVREELLRIVEGQPAAAGLRLLETIGALPYILPELVPTRGETQSPPHGLDVWNHTLDVIKRLNSLLAVLTGVYDESRAASQVLGEVSLRLGRYREQLTAHLAEEILPGRTARALLFWAALYHDSGKPSTRSSEENGQIRFLGHEEASAERVVERALSLHMSRSELERLQTIVRHHMRPLLLAQTGAPPSRRAIYRYFRDTGPAGVDICLLSLADMWGTYGAELPQEAWANQVQVARSLLEAWWETAEETVAPEPLLNGTELLRRFHLTPGPRIGRLLEALREAQATGEVSSQEEALNLIARLLEDGSE